MTAPAVNSYSVSLIFGGEVEQTFRRLRREVESCAVCPRQPHITLIYDFLPADSLDGIVERLGDLSKRLKPFRLELEGIKYFNTVNNVAYVGVKNREKVDELITAMVESIKDAVTGYYAQKEYSLQHHMPHLTIGEKIPGDRLEEIQSKLAGYNVSHACEVREFYLAGETDGEWQIIKKFVFGEGGKEKGDDE
jgi:2'-5' RNA ligase